MTSAMLRQAREARGLTIDDIGRKTGARKALLHLIDDGAFERLPAGLYGRAAVRAYATAVGIDPAAALAAVAAELPRGEDPLDGLARVRGLARRAASRPLTDAGLQGTWHMGGGKGMRAAAAAAVDGALLAALAGALVGVAAAFSRVPVHVVTADGAVPLLILSTLVAVVYYVLLGGIRGATIGSGIAHWAPPDLQEGSDVQAILSRAARFAIGDVLALGAGLVHDGGIVIRKAGREPGVSWVP